jgi:hypothetical protein
MMEKEAVCETPGFKSTLALLIARDISILVSHLKPSNISHLMLLEIIILKNVHHLSVLSHN